MRETDLDHICESIGFTPTRMLEAWFHGRTLYVPQTARPEHPLALVIGMPALRKLCADWKLCTVRIPKLTAGERYYRERRVAELLAEGLTVRTVAEQVNLSTRRVEQLQHELRLRGWLEFADFRSESARAAGGAYPRNRARRVEHGRQPPVLKVLLPG